MKTVAIVSGGLIVSIIVGVVVLCSTIGSITKIAAEEISSRQRR